jgi:nucleoside-diphosphate-sugar epimerase
MKVLVLGSTGYIGRHLMKCLAQTPWAEPTGASRTKPGAPSGDAQWRALDTRDRTALARALTGFDAVVNCVAGDRVSIAQGALDLVEAATAARCPRIIHLSTMSVYGAAEGLLNEESALAQPTGWYGEAKRQAENHMREFTKKGGEVLVLRPGCVFGPGSELWVGRTARWLQSGRLGDLGTAGDGWSNLVCVADVCQAVVSALQLKVVPGSFPVFNLAAPDSPRWNEYFVDLAIAIGATPVRRISFARMRVDSLLAGPPLKIAERLSKYLKKSSSLPEPIPPGLVSLWGQHIRLDARNATQKLGVAWTSYSEGLQGSAAWFSESGKPANPTVVKAIYTSKAKPPPARFPPEPE